MVNWRGGLFRIWLVLSILWITGTLLEYTHSNHPFWLFVLAAGAPPLIALLAAWVAFWIFRGFRGKNDDAK